MSLFSKSLLGSYFNLLSGSNDRYVSAPHFPYNNLYQPGQPEWDKITGQERMIFETTGPLAIVINKKAQMKSAGIWMHLRNDEVVEDSPAIHLLQNPNPLQSGKDFIKELSIHRDVTGAFYTYGLKGSALQELPSALWNIVPDLMSIQTTGLLYQQDELDEIIKSFTFDKNGNGEIVFDPNDILYRTTINVSNPLQPLSPMASLAMEISNIRGAMGYRNVIIRRKGAIGIISADQKDGEGSVSLDIKEAKRMEEELQRQYGIMDKQMQIMIARYPMKWQPMNYETNKLMLFEEIDDNLRRIIDQYGMNEKIFSVKESGGLNNSGSAMLEAQRQVYQDTIIPESMDDAEAFTKYLGLPDNEKLVLDYSHLPAMKDDEVKKSQIIERKARAAVLLLGIEGEEFTPEQVREITGLDTEQAE